MEVTLREKKLPSGKISLYLDITGSGKRKKQSLGEFLYAKPKTPEERQHNKAISELARKILIKKKEEFRERRWGINEDRGDEDFIQYFREYSENYTKKDLRIVAASFKKFEEFCTERKIKQLPGRQLSEIFCKDFAGYLRQHLKFQSPHNYFKKFRACLSRATDEGITKVQTYKLRVHLPYDKNANRKQMMSSEEVLTMYEHHNPEKLIELAFIFSLNTALDYATLCVLKWKYISNDEIVFDRTKQQGQNRIPLNSKALEVIGNLTKGKPNEFIFPLPSWTACVKVIRKWAKRAGINKDLTWHSARHTIGKILKQEKKLNDFTLQNIYDHSKPETTARYGELDTDDKRSALNMLPGVKIKKPRK